MNNTGSKYTNCILYTPSGHYYKKKKTSNFGRYYNQKLTTFELFNASIHYTLFF